MWCSRRGWLRAPASLIVWGGAKMSITSDEVNFLVYRYLQESGKPPVNQALRWAQILRGMFSHRCVNKAAVGWWKAGLFVLQVSLTRRSRLASRVTSVSRTSTGLWCLLLRSSPSCRKAFSTWRPRSASTRWTSSSSSSSSSAILVNLSTLIYLHLCINNFHLLWVIIQINKCCQTINLESSHPK